MMYRVVTTEAYRFMVDCLKAVGTSSKAAEQQAELLIQADRFGHPSHGLNRLEMYLNDIKSGSCKPNNEPNVLKENDATAWVDANNVLGATASHFGMDIAIKKAQKTGVGWVSVKASACGFARMDVGNMGSHEQRLVLTHRNTVGSNHFGMAGFWAQKAADQGLIGMAYTNTSPLLAPTRSKEPALGTNPLACVAPASNDESFYLDMATTTVSVGKIEMQRRKGESLPAGWAQGPDGKETKDAGLAIKTSCLMPLGGGELTSGHKGFGLAAMVELFCGILSGSNYGHNVRPWSHSGAGGPANLAHCFVAVNPECFAPGSGDRLADCITHWRQMEPTDPNLPVLAPGDKEKHAAALTDARGYVMYVKQQIASAAALAETLNIKPMEVEMDQF